MNPQNIFDLFKKDKAKWWSAPELREALHHSGISSIHFQLCNYAYYLDAVPMKKKKRYMVLHYRLKTKFW
jgi:hypothetical protein